MTRYLWVVATAAVIAAAGVAADPPKDTAAAAFTRTQKLKGKVTVEAKNAPLKDILKDISDQLDEQKLRPLSVQYDIGISQNTRTTLAVKDVAADEALDQLLKSLGYGYIVVSKDKDRYDGWIKVVKGDARGYEPGTEPKDAPKPGAKPPAPAKPEEKKPDPPKTEPKPDDKKPADPAAAEEEKTARGKLDSAKKLIADGKTADAKPLLKYVVKFHPTTASAAEAKKLLDEMK
jgi:TolA-binding protein